MLECYNKKLLRINLTSRTYKEETLSDDFIMRWIGGMGFGTRFLTQELDPKADPLSPENGIYISIGPLTGTSAPLFAQTSIITKSLKESIESILQTPSFNILEKTRNLKA